MASAHIFSYNWNVSEEEIRRAMTKRNFEGEDWRRSLLPLFRGRYIVWNGFLAQKMMAETVRMNVVLFLCNIFRKGKHDNIPSPTEIILSMGTKGIIEFYCVEEIPWVTFYACETASSGVCQSDESAEFSLSATVSSDGETFKESTSMTPEDSYLSILLRHFFE